MFKHTWTRIFDTRVTRAVYVYGGAGRIRTHEVFTPQMISSQRRYDHFGTAPYLAEQERVELSRQLPDLTV